VYDRDTSFANDTLATARGRGVLGLLCHNLWNTSIPGCVAIVPFNLIPKHCCIIRSAQLDTFFPLLCIFSGSRNVKVGKINESHPHDEQMSML
jgi:hypothetical protein